MELVKGEGSEVFLETELKRQAENFVHFGFHKELRLSPEGYLDSLLRIRPEREVFQGQIGRIILVEPRIDPERQCELIGISYLSTRKGKDWPGDPQKYQTPKTPYCTNIWLEETDVCSSVKEVRCNLAVDKRGMTDFDGLGLCCADPKIPGENYFVDLPGTSVSPIYAACLIVISGRRILNCSYVEGHTKIFHPGICSRRNFIAL